MTWMYSSNCYSQWLPTHRNVDGGPLTIFSIQFVGSCVAFFLDFNKIKQDFRDISDKIKTTIMDSSKFVLFLLAFLIADVHCIMWYLEPNTEKCLKEEIQGDVLMTGEYQISEATSQRIDYLIKDTKGHVLAKKDDIPHGKLLKFSFVTETYDTFEICFVSRVPNYLRGVRQEVKLVTKHGIEAKSYEGLGEAAKLKPIEVELKRLEDLSEAIVQDFARMRQNEEQMRDTNETTNARVLYFSIFSMCCLLGLATWQVFYLRRFFRAKKLIE